MRLVRMIPIKGCEPPTFLTWSKKVFSYIEKLPGTSIHIAFDNYAYYPDSLIPLSKGRKSDGVESNIFTGFKATTLTKFYQIQVNDKSSSPTT